jgi:hypothetical protein
MLTAQLHQIRHHLQTCTHNYAHTVTKTYAHTICRYNRGACTAWCKARDKIPASPESCPKHAQHINETATQQSPPRSGCHRLITLTPDEWCALPIFYPLCHRGSHYNLAHAQTAAQLPPHQQSRPCCHPLNLFVVIAQPFQVLQLLIRTLQT